MFCYFTFESIHFVLKAEKLIISEGIKLDIIPTPRDLSSDCGMCIKVDLTEKESVMTIIMNNNIATSYHIR